ncbi:MAG: DUF4834 family protein [Bacteroidia bacterium]
MQELFYTLLVGWILWRIFSPSRRSDASSGQYYYQQNTHHHHQNNTQERVRESAKTDASKSKDSDDDYVDFEEIK